MTKRLAAASGVGLDTTVRRLASLALGLLLWARPATSDGRAAPSLVVLVIVDQFAAHQFERWEPLMRGGLRALADRGAVYTQARYAYANTVTAAGHATATTGAWPAVHGIVANRWYEEGTGRRTYCYSDAAFGRSPRNLMAQTFADGLVLATSGRSKVVAVSLKDRAAIPMGGTHPTLSAWYDKGRGGFVAGAWDGATKPAWFERAVSGLGAESARGKTWTYARQDVDYLFEAGPDAHPAEAKVDILGSTFPHVIPENADPEQLRRVYPATPQALDAVFDLARRALDEEQLGRRGAIDLLGIGVSTPDYTGHWWGAHSQEHLDSLLRTDARLGELLQHLDRTLGRDRYVVAVTADHGSVLAPEKARMMRVEARRVDKAALEEAVRGAVKGEARLLEVNPPMIFLSPTTPAKDRAVLRRRVVEAVRGVPGIIEAHTVENVGRFAEPFGPLFSRSLFRGRRPDVMFLVRPGAYVSRVDSAGNGVGTGHGSPYVNDMAVPLLIAGPGVRAGIDRRPVLMTQLAPTLAAALSIPPPASALYPPLEAVDP